MRKILLLTALIIGYYLPTFSQMNRPLKIDSTFKNLSLNNSAKTLNHFDTIDFKNLFNKPVNNKDFSFTKRADKNLILGRESIGIFGAQKSIDNMPCLKPQGLFSMPIYKPDSTVKYTMLIKKFK